MKKLVHSACSLILALCLLASIAIFPVGAASNQPSTYSNDSNSGQRDVICTTLDGTDVDDYYTGQYTFDNLSDKNGNTLLSALRTLMTNTHKKNSSYDDCKNMAGQTDCQNEDGTIVLLYTSYVSSTSKYAGSGSNGWNREHVWPKSLGGFNTSGPGADLHHIRPDDYRTNGDRGNKKYGNVSGGTASKATGASGNTIGGYYNSTYFEPLDNVKGDVARICLYVYVRYGGSFSKCSSITNVFQSVDVLLEWCEEDPVDTWEMGRNEVVADYQGNRNVFIDYPELAWLLFNEDVPEDMVTPSGNADDIGGGNSTTTTKKPATTTKKPVTTTTKKPTATTTTAPIGDEECEHRHTELRNVRKPSCATEGYTGDTCCLDCHYVMPGENIAALGHQNLNGDKLCDICDMLLSSDAVITTKKPTTTTTRPTTTTVSNDETSPTTSDSSISHVGGADPGKPDSPSHEISLWIIIGVAVLVAVTIVLIIVIRSRKKEPNVDEIG